MVFIEGFPNLFAYTFCMITDYCLLMVPSVAIGSHFSKVLKLAFKAMSYLLGVMGSSVLLMSI